MTAHRGGLNHCSVPRSPAGRVSPVDRRRRRRPLPVPLVTAVIRGQVPLLLAGDYSRRVVGWQLSPSLRTDLALDALETGSGLAPTSATPSTGWSTTPTAVGTSPFATPSGWPRPAPSPRSARPGTPTTTPWPRRSTRCSGPSWSATASRGEASTTSRSPSPSPSTGSTTAGCTARSASSHPPSTRTPITVTTPPRQPSKRQFRASTEPGAGQVG